MQQLFRLPVFRSMMKRPLLLLFLFYLLLHIFIFWQALVSWPDIIAGRQFIAKDELIPIFDWSSQFFNQIVGGGKSLTYSNEVRLSYTFWTAWVRYSPILPGALVLLNTLSAFLFTYSIFRVIKSLLHPARLRYVYLTLYAALLGTLPIYLILLYSKLTTFYSLIIGFSLFALAISLLITHVFVERRMTVRRGLAVGLLVLINPAIHFHALFYIICVFVLAGVILLYAIKKSWSLWWQFVRYAAIVVAVSAVPYALLIVLSLKAAGAGDVADQIPLSYWGIYYNSIPLEHQFGFSTTAQMDVGKYGSYLATVPRLATMIMFGVLIAGFILMMRMKSFSRMTKLFIASFVCILIAMFMTIGYGENKSSYSFHVMLSQLTGLMDHAGQVGAYINKAAYTFMNILRYPHRFQFIQYYFAALALSMSVLALLIYFRSKLKIVLPLIGIIIIGAVFADGDYRSTFASASGDMGGFTRAYHVSDTLSDIRGYLQRQNDPKLFIVPSLESGRVLKQEDKTYSFIDKAWIYYLNTPTYYYGAGASMENKAVANEVYTSLSANTPTWEYVLANSIQATHVLIPKGTWVNLLQVQYQPHLERDIRRALKKLTLYKPVISGSDYILLERTAKETADNCIVDEAVMLSSCQPGARAYFPLQLTELRQTMPHATAILHTKDIERSKVSLEAAANPDNVFYPSSDRLPYQEDMVEGSVFATTGPSLQVLRMEKSRYNLFHRKLPPMSSLLAPKFVGTTTQGTKLDYHVAKLSGGKHELYLFALANSDELPVRINGKSYIAQAISSTDKNNYRYYRLVLDNASSAYKVTVTQASPEPLVVSHLYVRDDAVNPLGTVKELSPRVYELSY